MFFKKKRQPPKCFCHVSVVLQAIQNVIGRDTGVIDILFSYHGKQHCVGLCSEFSQKKGFYDEEFYLDNQLFTTFDDFKAGSVLGGTLFVNTPDRLEITTVDDAPPHCFPLFEPYLVDE